MRALDREGHDVAALRWRIGRKLGRTIYAMIDDEPDDRDLFVGMADTRDIAELIVAEHNVVWEGL